MLAFHTQAQSLADALSLSARAVAQRDQVPALTGVLLRAHSDALEITTSNGEVSMRVTAPATVEAQDTLLVPARTFSDLIRLVPGPEEVQVRGVDGQAGVRFLRSRFDLPTLRAEEFPELDFGAAGQPVKLATDDLRALVRRVAYAIASRDDGRLFTVGIHLTLHDGYLDAACTDNHQLAWARAAAPEAAHEEKKILLPARAFAEIVRALPDKETELFLGEKTALLRTATVTVAIGSIRSEFPDVGRVVPSTPATVARFDTQELLQAVERTQLVTGRHDARIKLQIENDTLRVSARSSEAGQGSEELATAASGQDIEFAFAPKYLIDAVKSLPPGQAVLQATHAQSPVLFRPDGEQEEQFAIVMPLKTPEMAESA